MGPSSISDFARFFMMNGQYHTWGTGPGATSNLHLMDIMEQWVETGVAPEKIVGEKLATNGTVLFRRPSFPWPYFAWYRGGDVNDEASFEPRNRDYQL
jgi:feruloyl esterase